MFRDVDHQARNITALSCEARAEGSMNSENLDDFVQREKSKVHSSGRDSIDQSSSLIESPPSALFRDSFVIAARNEFGDKALHRNTDHIRPLLQGSDTKNSGKMQLVRLPSQTLRSRKCSRIQSAFFD
jgi:hypothetical protein